MSALTPHIRVLRAESEALLDQAKGLRIDGRLDAALVILSIGRAKLDAAHCLEAADPSLPEDKHPITYDPKGKR